MHDQLIKVASASILLCDGSVYRLPVIPGYDPPENDLFLDTPTSFAIEELRISLQLNPHTLRTYLHDKGC